MEHIEQCGRGTVIGIDAWECPEQNGIPLLGMPSCPRALTGVGIESVRGETFYKKYCDGMRKGLKHECAICKKRLILKRDMLVQDLYDIDRRERLVTFSRSVLLCPLCYDAVNFRRAIWLYHAKYGKYSKNYILKVVKHCFEHVSWYRKVGLGNVRPDYVYVNKTGGELGYKIRQLADSYGVNFVDLKGSSYWGKWQFLFDGQEYLTPFGNEGQWLATWFKRSNNGKYAQNVIRVANAPKIAFDDNKKGVILWGTTIDEWNSKIKESKTLEVVTSEDKEDAPRLTSVFADFDIETVDHWECLEDKGAPLLTMPNVPHALHGKGMQPRTIFGATVWDFMRKQCMKRAGNRSEVSGVEFISEKLQVHELFKYDYSKQEGVFVRCVALTGMEHDFIHSGRMVTLYKEGAPKYTKEYVLKTIENGFKIISEYNESHPEQVPLRVYWSILNLLKTDLGEDVGALIKRYNIKFYREHIKKNKRWRGWHVIVGSNRYGTPYSNQGEWQEAMKEASAKDAERNKGTP